MTHGPNPDQTVNADYTLHCEECGEDYNAPFCPGYAREWLREGTYLRTQNSTIGAWNSLGKDYLRWSPVHGLYWGERNPGHWTHARRDRTEAQ